MTQSDADRAKAYRERKRLAVLDRGKPWEGSVGEVREQAIRDYFGYAKSETRTQAERQAVADRIMGRVPRAPGPVEGRDQSFAAERILEEGLSTAKQRYIDEAARLARAVTLKGDKRDATVEAGREQRARGYAAWRWESFHRGETASL